MIPCMLLLTLAAWNCDAAGAWSPAPIQEGARRDIVPYEDTLEYATPLVDLGLPDGEDCGPPWFQVGDLSVWSSLLPRYRQQFGWELRWGIHGDRSRIFSGTATLIYNQRESRLYQHLSLNVALPGSHTIRLSVTPYYRVDDGSRRGGLTAYLEATDEHAQEAWLDAYLNLESQRYFHLRHWPADRWQAGHVARANAGISFDFWHRNRGLLRRLIGGAHVTLAGRVMGAQLAYRRASATICLRGTSGLLRADGGWVSAHSPVQSRMDLGREGQFVGKAPGMRTGYTLLAMHTETWLRVWAGLYLVAFSSLASIAPERTLYQEGGVGLGLRPTYDKGMGPWKLRIDFPVMSSDPGDARPLAFVRAVSIRVWVWPGLLGPCASPDSDFVSSK